VIDSQDRLLTRAAQKGLPNRDREGAAYANFRNLVLKGVKQRATGQNRTGGGRLDWVSDRTGYRYDPVGHDTGSPRLAMPAADLAVRAATEAGLPERQRVAPQIDAPRRHRNPRFFRNIE
jgi:hypothetical protein